MAIHYLSVFGLVLITAGWCTQYLSMKKGKKDVVKTLPVFNIVGISFLIVEAFQGGATDIVIGNALTLTGAALVFLAIKDK